MSFLRQCGQGVRPRLCQLPGLHSLLHPDGNPNPCSLRYSTPKRKRADTSPRGTLPSARTASSPAISPSSTSIFIFRSMTDWFGPPPPSLSFGPSAPIVRCAMNSSATQFCRETLKNLWPMKIMFNPQQISLFCSFVPINLSL